MIEPSDEAHRRVAEHQRAEMDDVNLMKNEFLPCPSNPPPVEEFLNLDGLEAEMSEPETDAIAFEHV